MKNLLIFLSASIFFWKGLFILAVMLILVAKYSSLHPFVVETVQDHSKMWKTILDAPRREVFQGIVFLFFIFLLTFLLLSW